MKAKILLVEDSPVEGAALVETLTRMGYEVSWARGGIEALRMAKLSLPDVVLLDVVMKDMDGHAVCRWLKLSESTRDVPVIMLTVKREIADKIEGLHVGADDYLSKPFNDEELEARIFAILRSVSPTRELRSRNRELERMLQRVEAMAMTDELTGLFNRRRFGDAFRREWASARRYKNPLSLLMADIDHFKSVNDLHGHAVGDATLRDVSRVLMAGVREVDLPARYGGEEFAILLPQTPLVAAVAVAERLRQQVRSLAIVSGESRVQVTISVGVASAADVDTTSHDEMVLHADQALYAAKTQGRDRVVTFDSLLPSRQ